MPTTSWGRTCWPPTVGASIPLKSRYWGLSGVKVANNNAIAARKGAARRTARAELYRRINLDYQPTYWGFRLFNGGQQQITVLLGNPHLHEHQNYVDQPDWNRLYLGNWLSGEYLGQGVDPTDRTAAGFWPG